MSEETKKVGMDSKLKALLIAVVSAGLGILVTYMTTGDTPDPVDVTCEMAREITASDACQSEPEAPEAVEEPVVEEPEPVVEEEPVEGTVEEEAAPE